MSPTQDRLIVVTGATGNIGRTAAERLLAGGFKVRALGRDRAKLAALRSQGAEALEGSLEDAAFLDKAFAGADSAFLMIPPNYPAPDLRAWQNKVGENLARATQRAGLRLIVNLSSVGAQHDKGTGPVLGLHDQEKRLGALDAAVVHLRPGFFMENHLFAIGSIQALGAYGTALDPDLPVAQIAARDIGAFTAGILAAAEARDKTAVELLGPRDLSMSESAALLGAAVGRPRLKVLRFAYDEARAAMLGMGMSASTADAMIEMYRGFPAGLMKGIQTRGAANTGATTLEVFAKDVFAPAFGRPAAAH